jgi:hypothetical protein
MSLERQPHCMYICVCSIDRIYVYMYVCMGMYGCMYVISIETGLSIQGEGIEETSSPSGSLMRIFIHYIDKCVQLKD